MYSGFAASQNSLQEKTETSESSFVFPGKTWERIKDLAKVGYSAEDLEKVIEYTKTLDTTGLMVVVGGKVLLEYGDLEELSYLASVRKSILAMLYGKYVGNQYIDESNTPDLAIDPYYIINLSGWLQIDQVRVTARINNMLDTLYATYGYNYYGGYYWPGATRNISLAVDMQL